MIPDEAVEAAHNARLSFKSKRGVDNSAALMRHILEAAAPHMLEQAWESGWANARGHYMARYAGQEIPEWVTLRNPYGAAK